MGSLFGGGTTSTTQNSSTQPWAAQQPYLTQGLQQASDIEGQRMAQGPYSGNYYAGTNPSQTSAVANASGWANGTGAQIPQGLANTSSQLMGGAQGYLNNASGMAANGVSGTSGLQGVLNGYATGATPGASTNQALSGALNTAAINGANTLNGFTQGQQQVMNQSLEDPTQQLSADAQSYMNSAPVQSAINSTNAQINQQLNESTVPQLNRTAAAGGALNSSRAGMAESMANENAAIATGNADSQIQNNAYNTGLSTAAAERNAGLTTGMYAANSGLVDNSGLAQGQQSSQLGQSEFNTNTALGATGTGLNYDLGNANTMLNANGQLGNAVNMGMNGYGAANNAAIQNFGLGSSAGTYQQQMDQGDLNNQYAQWQGSNTYDQGVLNNYWGIAGQPLGSQSQSTGTSTQPSNTLGSLAGLGVLGASLFSGGAGGGILSGLTGANGLSGISGTVQGLSSAAGQYLNPYQMSPTVASNGLMGMV